MVERIYLDTCVWCRVFDLLDHERIRQEFEAVVGIIGFAIGGEVQIVNSDLVSFEVSKVGKQRNGIEKLINDISGGKLKTTHATKRLAEDIMNECCLNALDALHIALAIENDIVTFITTDDEILSRRKCIEKYGLDVINPVRYEVE